MTKSKISQAPSVTGKKGFSLISNEKFRQLYAALFQCRILSERLRATPGCDTWPGCEAPSAAVLCCLRCGDTVIPTKHAMLANYLDSGSPDSHPGQQGLLAGNHALPLHSGPASQFAAATQAALRLKRENRSGLVVLFTGLATPAVMRKAFAGAARQSLPVLYVLEGGTPSAEISSGIPVIRVDAYDAVALYRVVFESSARAREGTGPTIIECAAWPADAEPDPLLKLEHYLAAKKLFRPQWKRTLEKSIPPNPKKPWPRLPLDSTL